ncbi:hypothetical protein IW261DRAFT_1660860 [Armillaria novae-zelandiae]|uniref:DUF6534 domain-containing protein n=1 Tax=Armillaria novae-zelandiae TaxID=153914 RepID=A0AA39NVP7_9AGAR|nr:hypothetical protein IW261DRAFT_1660860 [Armillaria novae-zelandiae]
MSSSPPRRLNLITSQGGLLIGILFSVFLFGISTVQTWFYYQHYPKDRKTLKFMVATLWILELIHAVFACHSIYWYLALNYANPAALGTSIWSADSTLIASGLITFQVHVFFAWRVWKLSAGRLPVLPTMIVRLRILLGGLELINIIKIFVGFAACALTITTSGLSFAAGTFAKYPHSISVTSTTALALSVFADLMIAFSISFFLRQGRSGLTKTDHIINRLIFWSMNVGILTSLLDLIVLITSEAQDNLNFLAVFEVVASVYANSLLATLNIRAISRGQVLNEDGTSLELDSSDYSHSVDFTAGPKNGTQNLSKTAIQTDGNSFSSVPGARDASVSQHIYQI